MIRHISLLPALLLLMVPRQAEAESLAGGVANSFFSIFRSDQTAGLIAVSMLGVATIITYSFYVRTYRPLRKDIANASRAFSASGHPESFAGIYNRVEETLNESRFLAPIWFEFRETMSRAERQDGTVIWQNTKRPQDYFTADAISKQRGSINAIDFWPNTFVGIGLLVTFLGLTVAVKDTAFAIKSASGNVEEVLGALEGLLAVASIKFTTSVSGIFCSILMTLAIRNMQSIVRQELNGLHDRIERNLEFLSIERLQLRTIDAIESMSISISKGVADGVQGIAGNELRSFAEELRHITETLTNSKKEIKEFGKIYDQQLASMSVSFTSQMNTASDSLANWSEGLEKQLSTNMNSIATQLDAFSSGISNFVKQANETSFDAQKDLRTTIDSVTQSFERATRAISEKVEEQAKVSKTYLEGVDRLVLSLNENSADFAQATDKAMTTIAEDRQNAIKAVEDFATHVTQIRAAIGQHSEKLSQVINEVATERNTVLEARALDEKTIAELTAKLSGIVERLDGVFLAAQENMDKSFQPLQGQLEKLIDRMNSSVGGPQSNLISKFFKG